jgi:hypothetical protein
MIRIDTEAKSLGLQYNRGPENLLVCRLALGHMYITNIPLVKILRSVVTSRRSLSLPPVSENY